jgi:hypothetical protein
LHRCLQRCRPLKANLYLYDKPSRKKFKAYPIGYFHIDLAEKGELRGPVDRDELSRSYGINPKTVLKWRGGHPFDRACWRHGIEHRLTKPKHPWTNGQVERMNRTIKEATVKRYHYDSHDQLRSHVSDFVSAYNFARRLKTLRGLTPYEYICSIWTKEPERFRLDPIHQMPGQNT